MQKLDISDIKKLLRKPRTTRSALSNELGIDRKTLYNQLKAKGIKVESGDLVPKDVEKILKGLNYI